MNNRAPKISVAIATYNGASFLWEQLKSIESQEMAPLEIVVCDDQSTDGSVEILRRFAKSCSIPLKIYENDINIGYKKNFLRCCSLCEGDFIALCDQDDIWLPTKICSIFSLLQQDVTMVYHNAAVFNGRTTLGLLYTADREVPDYDDIRRFLFAPWGMTIVFRKDLLRYRDMHNISRNPDVLGSLESHDQWLFFVADLLGKVVYIPSVLAYYRQHGANLVGWGRGDVFTRSLKILSDSVARPISLVECVSARIDFMQSLTEERVPLDRVQALNDKLRLLRRRVHVYEGPSVLSRLGRLYRALLEGLYLQSAFGFKAFAKDLIMGVLLLNWIKKFGKISQSTKP